MAKFNVDDILSDLGVSKDAGKPPAKKPPAAPAAPAKPTEPHRIDKAEESFSPLPPMPGNQRGFGDEKPTTTDDPAVKKPPADVPGSTVGSALADVYKPDVPKPIKGTDIGDYLASTGVVTPAQLATAQGVVKQTPGKKVVDVLLEQGADENAVQKAVADHAGLPFERVDLNKGIDGGFDGKLLQKLSPEFCKESLVLPLRKEGMRTVIGVTRPDNVYLLDEVRKRLGAGSLKVVIITPHDVKGAIESLSGGDTGPLNEADVATLLDEVDESDVQVEKAPTDELDLEKLGAESPVIRYVNYIIQQAIKEGASDIHIEPGEKKLKVRFRVDGELFEGMNPPSKWAAAITSRLKIMANLDIAERRIPQDGRIRCSVQGRKLDLRVSTLPVAYGEKTVMRILDTRSINVKLEELGFDEDTLVVWKKQIDLPHGIILVTGPTGSGKTTTLYASLRQLDKNSMNVSTVEDPIEYHLDGIVQTQTHEKIGMTFARALKALLRQDPDVIMLGEIRDQETAITAVQAALTGHLVLSTLHTNDAPSSITRLVNIGLEPFLVGAAINSVLAQRLVRKLCPGCKYETPPTEELAEFMSMQGMNAEKVWASRGCERCRKTGYSGRVGIYELLTIDDQVRDIIARNPNVAEFRRLCLERGMVSLRADGLKKVAKGVTTVQEILRVTDATI